MTDYITSIVGEIGITEIIEEYKGDYKVYQNKQKILKQLLDEVNINYIIDNGKLKSVYTYKYPKSIVVNAEAVFYKKDHNIVIYSNCNKEVLEFNYYKTNNNLYNNIKKQVLRGIVVVGLRYWDFRFGEVTMNSYRYLISVDKRKKLDLSTLKEFY